MSAFAIGVDLGGTNLRIAAVDVNGKVLEKISTNTQVSRGRDEVVFEMAGTIRELMSKFRTSGHLAGIGIGIPGIIDMQSGMLRESPNLPGWQDYPVKDEIERSLGATVVLENDANAAALGEKWLGAAHAADDMCMITLGTGVGGGIVLQGRIWHGMTGMAGEIGHITVEPGGVPCGCGSRGCVEQYASATAIKRMAVEAIASGKAPELARAMTEDPEFSARVVHQMAVQGDPPAIQIFQTAGRALGIMIANVINTLNLPMHVIGGGVSSAWDAFSPSMLDEIRRRSFIFRATRPQEIAQGITSDVPSGRRNTIIAPALLGSDAGLMGAARLPMLADDLCQSQQLKRA